MSERRGPQSATASGTRVSIELPLVLIVDDNADNRDLFAMVLERLGYAIELAVDGLEGLAHARATSPTVILMDLAMPNMDGFEATRAIRAEPELADVYIIAVTAFSDALTSQRALAAGCNEFLAKPLSPDILAARVEAAVDASFARARDAS